MPSSSACPIVPIVRNRLTLIPKAAVRSSRAALPIIGSRDSTIARVEALAAPPGRRGGSSTCWSILSPPPLSTVQPRLRCCTVYGSSWRRQRKMWARMISVARVRGGCTWQVPEGTSHSPGRAIAHIHRRMSLTPSPVFAESMKPGQSNASPIPCNRPDTSSRRSLGWTRSTLLSTSAVRVRLPSGRCLWCSNHREAAGTPSSSERRGSAPLCHAIPAPNVPLIPASVVTDAKDGTDATPAPSGALRASAAAPRMAHATSPSRTVSAPAGTPPSAAGEV
mmetsp:Transcript_10941/g.36282  ORF Transcript_10941/g.36282 Transcript_10941/m.36282 type:complete len:279 (+) Transcript_10941:313-1149(+)